MAIDGGWRFSTKLCTVVPLSPQLSKCLVFIFLPVWQPFLLMLVNGHVIHQSIISKIRATV